MAKERSHGDPCAGPLLWSRRAAVLRDPLWQRPGSDKVPVCSDVLMLLTSERQLVTSAARQHQLPEPVPYTEGWQWCFQVLPS